MFCYFVLILGSFKKRVLKKVKEKSSGGLSDSAEWKQDTVSTRLDGSHRQHRRRLHIKKSKKAKKKSTAALQCFSINSE